MAYRRHGINSIPELELMGYSILGIGIDYLKKLDLELRNCELELKYPTEKLNIQINLPFLQH